MITILDNRINVALPANHGALFQFTMFIIWSSEHWIQSPSNFRLIFGGLQLGTASSGYYSVTCLGEDALKAPANPANTIHVMTLGQTKTRNIKTRFSGGTFRVFIFAHALVATGLMVSMPGRRGRMHKLCNERVCDIPFYELKRYQPLEDGRHASDTELQTPRALIVDTGVSCAYERSFGCYVASSQRNENCEL